MSEAGGPTTQSGILYQNSVAALYLGRLLDTSQRPDNERVIQVRVEAPEHVDDIVVRFADEHRVFIQVKESIKSSSPEWHKMWEHFDQQFRDHAFQRNQDRLLLQIGNWRDEHDHLSELCKRAATSDTIAEWHDRNKQAESALLEKIKPALLPTGLTDEYLLQLLGHIDVEIVPLRALERDYVPNWMPQTNKLPKEIFRLLRDRVGIKSRARDKFTAHELRQSLISESTDLQFDLPADIATLQAAVRQCGSLLRQHKDTFADTDLHIEREVVDQIVEWLLTEDDIEKNVAMLLDQAGMGKTVVMRSVLHRLDVQKIDVLAIKADQQLSDITALPEIQHKLGLPYPTEQIIIRLAQLNRVVVLIDQIDALSLSLAHDQSTLDTTLDFVARLRRIPNVRILLSCRIFDRNTDPRLKRIELGHSFSLQPLSVEQVTNVLTNLQVNEAALSQTTRELLRIPLHLDLFARAVATESTLEQLRGIASLQELYALIWQNVVLKQQAGSPSVADRIEVINQLTRYMDQQQRTAAPQSLLQTAETAHLEQAVNWLASIGILLPGKTEWSFLHQTFFDYCYARQFVEDGGDIVSTIFASKQGLFERPKLIQIMAYLRGSDHHRYIRDLQRLLNASNLRFHLYDVLLRWFGSLPNPTDDEWLIAQQMLRDDQKRQQLFAAMDNNAGWFNHIRPFLENCLSHGDDVQLRQALFYLTSLIEKLQTDVVLLLKPFVNKGDEWCQRIASILSRIRDWQTDDAIELYETIIYKQSALDHLIMWRIGEISKKSPKAACRILAYVFDLALNQQLQGVDKSTIILSINLFSDFHYIGFEDTLNGVSKLEPKLFTEMMLPWVIRVVTLQSRPNLDQRRYLSDSLSYNWYGDTFREQLAFIHSLIGALTQVAQNEPDYFRPLADGLKELPYETPQHLLTHIYRALPKLYAKNALEFLIADPRRLNIGDREQYDSRQVISAIYPHLIIEQRQQLEKHILNYAPIYKPSSLYDLQWSGIEQYCLLHAIPEQYLSQEGQKRFQEWQRKFVDYRISEKPIVIQGGVVGSPIEGEKTFKMSDYSWLQAMKKYHGATEHRDFLKGSGRQLSPLLVTQIQNDPARFYRLFQRIPDDVDDTYATAFINGFSEPASAEKWFFNAIRRFATQEDRNIKRPVARAIEKQAKSDVPDDILDLLINWIYDSMNDDEWWWTQGNTHGDAYHSYLNSDRGAAFEAAMRVLDARDTEDAREQKWQLFEFVASDPSTALRIGAIRELTHMIQYDRSRSWSLFEQLIADHEVLLEAYYVREFLYWSFHKNFLQVSTYIKKMMHYTNEETQEQGAGLACVAAISGGAMESDEALAVAQALAEQAISGIPAWRRGAAHIYSYNMTDSSSDETRHLCQAKVCQLIDDEDKSVREKIDNRFVMISEHFFELRDFMEEFVLAEHHPLEHPFAEYLWEHGMQDPDWSLTIIQTLLHKKEQPDQWRSGIEELMRLVLQIYTSPTVNDATKDEAMDTFDLLMQQYAGTANNILSEWDRR